MDIKSCLAIEAECDSTVNLILSGSFARVYNRSFYLLTEAMGKSLKANIRYVKNAGNQLVVSGGFPFHLVEKQFPQAKRCEWGYQIAGSFNLSGYSNWLLRHEMAVEAAENVVTAAGSACPHLCAQAEPANYNDTVYNNSVNLSLNPQQIAYLRNWQRSDYLLELDLAFIESLKQQIVKTNSTK